MWFKNSTTKNFWRQDKLVLLKNKLMSFTKLIKLQLFWKMNKHNLIQMNKKFILKTILMEKLLIFINPEFKHKLSKKIQFKVILRIQTLFNKNQKSLRKKMIILIFIKINKLKIYKKTKLPRINWYSLLTNWLQKDSSQKIAMFK